MIQIVLIEPENPGNIGAIARAMANFGLDRMILVGPKADHLCDGSRNRAKHAQKILQDAIIKPYSYFMHDQYDSVFCDSGLVIATTSVLGSDYNVPRLPISPEDMLVKIRQYDKVSIIFGREGPGLNNEEIGRCDLVVTIPSSKDYPALNLSQAAVIIFYELFKGLEKNDGKKVSDHIQPASRQERDQALKMVNRTLDRLEFSTPEKRRTQELVWKNLINKSFLTKREMFSLFGYLRKLDEELADKKHH